MLRMGEDVAHSRDAICPTDQVGARRGYELPSRYHPVEDALLHLSRAESIGSAEGVQGKQLVNVSGCQPKATLPRPLGRAKVHEHHAPHGRHLLPGVEVANHRKMPSTTGQIDLVRTQLTLKDGAQATAVSHEEQSWRSEATEVKHQGSQLASLLGACPVALLEQPRLKVTYCIGGIEPVSLKVSQYLGLVR